MIRGTRKVGFPQGGVCDLHSSRVFWGGSQGRARAPPEPTRNTHRKHPDPPKQPQNTPGTQHWNNVGTPLEHPWTPPGTHPEHPQNTPRTPPGVFPGMDIPHDLPGGFPGYGDPPGVPQSLGHRLFFWCAPTPTQTRKHNIQSYPKYGLFIRG